MIAPASFMSTGRNVSHAGFAEEETGQDAAADRPPSRPCALSIFIQELLNLLPKPTIEEGFMFAEIDRALVFDFAYIKMIPQKLIESAARVKASSSFSSHPLVP